MKMEKLIVRNIKMRRCSLGMSQKDLAKKAKLGHSTIAQIEMGLKLPGFKTLIAITKALKLQAHEILMPELFDK